jgi:hypothetical protein
MVDLSTWTGMFVFAATTGRELWREHVKRKSEDSKRQSEASYLHFDSLRSWRGLHMPAETYSAPICAPKYGHLMN